jgi:hypothetical protein
MRRVVIVMVWMMRRRTTFGRAFSAYIAVVLLVAVVGPGAAVFADDGVVEEAVSAELATVDAVEAEPVAEEAAPVGEDCTDCEEEAAAEEVAADPEPAEAPPVVASAAPSVEAAPVTAEVAETGSVVLPICPGGVKLDKEPRDGTYTLSHPKVEINSSFPPPADFEIVLDTYTNSGGMFFDFESNYPVAQVKVKASTGYFSYDFTADPIYEGVGLHAPANRWGDWRDISHIIFCFGEVEEPEPGDIMVHKYLETGEDIPDADKPPLDGWEFNVYGSAPIVGLPLGADLSTVMAPLATGETGDDGDGKVLFTGFEPGTYWVVETPQDGWENTTPLAQEVIVPEGQTAHVWFGNRPMYGDLIVHKFLGGPEMPQEPEWLDGWEFTLYPASPPDLIPGDDFEFALNGGPIDSGVTGEGDFPTGQVIFEGLRPGWYEVVETPQDGWDNTTPLSQMVEVTRGGTAHLYFGNEPVLYDKSFELTYNSAPDGITGFSVSFYIGDSLEPVVLPLDGPGPVYTSEIMKIAYPYTLVDIEWIAHTADGDVRLASDILEILEGDTVNTLEYDPSLSGYKWDDFDGDSEWDDEGDFPETGIEDWTIYLYRGGENGALDMSDDPVAMTTTDEDGAYIFEGMLPGFYWVVEEEVDGWDPTTPIARGPFWVEAGVNIGDINFGNTEILTFPIDLAITKVANVETVDEGDIVTYTLTYWNLDDQPAEHYKVVDTFDATYMSVEDAAGGTVVGNTITWEFNDSLTFADGKKTIVYKMKVTGDLPDDESVNIDNDVVITLIDDELVDADPTNNFDDERVVSDPFLPFTGANASWTLLGAMLAGAAGLVLRRRSLMVV